MPNGLDAPSLFFIAGFILLLVFWIWIVVAAIRNRHFGMAVLVVLITPAAVIYAVRNPKTCFWPLILLLVVIGLFVAAFALDKALHRPQGTTAAGDVIFPGHTSVVVQKFPSLQPRVLQGSF